VFRNIHIVVPYLCIYILCIHIFFITRIILFSYIPVLLVCNLRDLIQYIQLKHTHINNTEYAYTFIFSYRSVLVFFSVLKWSEWWCEVWVRKMWVGGWIVWLVGLSGLAGSKVDPLGSGDFLDFPGQRLGYTVQEVDLKGLVYVYIISIKTFWSTGFNTLVTHTNYCNSVNECRYRMTYINI